jgi:hypothetical protein
VAIKKMIYCLQKYKLFQKVEVNMVDKQLSKTEYTIIQRVTKSRNISKHEFNFREVELMLNTVRYLIFAVTLVLIALILVLGGHGELVPTILKVIP